MNKAAEYFKKLVKQKWRAETAKHQRYRGGIVREILVKYLLSLVAWAVGVVVLEIFSWDFFSRFHWRGDEAFYLFLCLMKEYSLLVSGLAIVAGWVFLSYQFLSRPLRYLDDLVRAAEQLASPDSAPVQLPAAMHEVETQLNLVREQSLRAAMSAREAEQRKNDLVVYLAHDLKTPLTSIIGYLTLLRDEPQVSPELRAKYTGIALDKADRLEELINEFFEITRFNLSHLELERTPVDLSRMLGQLASEFEPTLRDKELSCETELPARLEYVCDPDKLARVFDNLLRNALHYSFPRSVIRITAEKSSSCITVAFQNVGPVIPADKLGRIFEQFFRLDASRGTRSGGAGLGLAIAKQIVEAHGGSIRAESADSRTQFTIELPL